MLKLIFILLIGFAAMSNGFADATIPTADKAGSKDNPLLKRYEGSYIVAYEHKNFDEFTLPLSKLEAVKDKRDKHHNYYYEPKDKKTLEGAYTRLVYLLPDQRSPLEVLRNYQDEIASKNGKVLFECKAEECGGDSSRSSTGWSGGSDMSLSMYLYPEERITDSTFSNGNCAMTTEITDQRYLVAELPESNAQVSIPLGAVQRLPESSNVYVSVLTYTHKGGVGCDVFNDRTIAIVDIVETKAREQKMVAVKAEDMAANIASKGSIALYGIYFEFNKADVKSESDATLEQIATLLKNDAALKLLVVGHTDNAGSFDFNMDLSQQRAKAVVNALIDKYAINKDRLNPVGVSFASPVASNDSEEGRAKNRRVELVKN